MPTPHLLLSPFHRKRDQSLGTVNHLPGPHVINCWTLRLMIYLPPPAAPWWGSGREYPESGDVLTCWVSLSGCWACFFSYLNSRDAFQLSYSKIWNAYRSKKWKSHKSIINKQKPLNTCFSETKGVEVTWDTKRNKTQPSSFRIVSSSGLIIQMDCESHNTLYMSRVKEKKG